MTSVGLYQSDTPTKLIVEPELIVSDNGGESVVCEPEYVDDSTFAICICTISTYSPDCCDHEQVTPYGVVDGVQYEPTVVVTLVSDVVVSVANVDESVNVAVKLALTGHVKTAYTVYVECVCTWRDGPVGLTDAVESSGERAVNSNA